MAKARVLALLVLFLGLSSSQAANFGVSSGLGYGLLGVNAEFPMERGVVEVGIGTASGIVSLVAGGKFFIQKGSSPLIAFRLAYASGTYQGYVVSGTLYIFSGGYRFSVSPLTFDIEVGLGYGIAFVGSYSSSTISPATGIRLGVEF